ncbi:MAG: hypothetical protein M1822_009130 [Bathelium mastoideum]|nr:MAG: hypothetical protein M1822_009130 [Bathelium mastoideum]
MRLLELLPSGDFHLTENFLDDRVPPYATLSHTWGDESQEVKFEDIVDGTGRDKDGYHKLEFCSEQASRDDLKYFWVDSCCIKKSSDAELSEAINSMFRWYACAARCYVYLSDVSTKKRKREDQVELVISESRWFNRGWTLQELLAPKSVEFFSREGERLGDKRSLAQQLHTITGITLSAIQGGPLCHLGINERFSWAQHRQTTRKEDWAYCLLGIFDISMPLIYGEGRDKAIARLEKEINGAFEEDQKLENMLERLPVAKDAPFNSLAKQHEPCCLETTRADLLQNIYNWADEQGECHMFWLYGLAGTGKSTIARTVARKYFDKGRLAASFFFTKGGGDTGNANNFVTSIAIQLASNVRALRPYISAAVLESSEIASLSFRDQWQKLVLDPLSKLESNGHRALYLLVVDALDECDDDRNIRMILQLLAKARSKTKIQLRIFLTSRPETPIRSEIYLVPDIERKDFALHQISQTTIDHDISVFLKHHLNMLAQERSLYAGWPGEDAIKFMIRIANGLFIWAATACKFIQEGQRFAPMRLDRILQGGKSSNTAPEKYLDEIYVTVLKHSVPLEYTNEEKEEAYRILRQVLGSIAILFSPLSVHALGRLLSLTRENIDQTIEDLHSILDIPKDEMRSLRLHHPSFRDFLLNKDRCMDTRFLVNEKQAHYTLTFCCLQLMSSFLKQDICDARLPGGLVTSVEASRIEQCLPSEVQYACLYWVQHLQKSSIQLRDNDEIHQFLKAHLLHWIEALAWMRKTSEGVRSIKLLESISYNRECPRLHALANDMKRFVLQSLPAIGLAPLQSYISALVFAPKNSIVRAQFHGKIPNWIQELPEVPHK